jgi:heme A synthase
MIMDLQGGFYVIKILHYIISATFLIIAVILISRSITGIVRKLEYSFFDRFLSLIFIINLYLQLIFGLILFSNLGSSLGYDYVSADGTVKMVSKRFWPIEHIALMIFALLIANLGFVFSNKSQESKSKYRNVLVYYCLAIVIIAYSLSSIYLF